MSRLRYAVPQWRGELKGALQRARQRLAHARVDGVDWYWPAGRARADRGAPADTVRLLAPFDPVVWDRRRFELFWGWAYRFEAYTPARKRKLGYYALPLLWRDRVIGWGNVSVKNGELRADLGVGSPPPRDRAFTRELEAELDRLRAFLAGMKQSSVDRHAEGSEPVHELPHGQVHCLGERDASQLAGIPALRRCPSCNARSRRRNRPARRALSGDSSIIRPRIALTRSCGRSEPVSAIIGIAQVAGARPFGCHATSHPSMSGKRRSSTMTFGAHEARERKRLPGRCLPPRRHTRGS